MQEQEVIEREQEKERGERGGKDALELALRIEALLFSFADSLSYKRLEQLLEREYSEIKKAASLLKEKYSPGETALEIVDINQSLKMVTRNSYAEDVDRLFETDARKGLSSAEMEVISIIAYEQPATKRDIERIRGIKSDRIIQNLLDKELIKIAGKKDAPGTPTLYGTSEKFLVSFGLKNLGELPKLAKMGGMKLFGEED